MHVQNAHGAPSAVESPVLGARFRLKHVELLSHRVVFLYHLLNVIAVVGTHFLFCGRLWFYDAGTCC